MGASVENWVNKRDRDFLSRRRVGTIVILSVVTSPMTLKPIHLSDQKNEIDQRGM